MRPYMYGIVASLLVAQAHSGTAQAPANSLQAGKDTAETKQPSGFRFSIGGNADWEDKVPDTFYGRASYWWPSFRGKIARSPSACGVQEGAILDRLGIYSGIYENRFFDTDERVLREGSFYDLLSFPKPDSVLLVRQGRTESSSRSFRNFAVFVTFPYTVHANYDCNSKRRTYVSFSLAPVEGMRQQRRVNYEYKNLQGAPDTATYHIRFLDSLSAVAPAPDLRYRPRANEPTILFHLYAGFADFTSSFHEEDFTGLLRIVPLGYHYFWETGVGRQRATFSQVYITFSAIGFRLGADVRRDWNASADLLVNFHVTKDMDLAGILKELIKDPAEPEKK